MSGGVPEFTRAYSPEERMRFASKPKPTSSDVYNYDDLRAEPPTAMDWNQSPGLVSTTTGS